MAKSQYTGNYTKAFLSEKVSPSDSIEQIYYSQSIKVAKDEACFVFSFKENKLLFSKGFEEVFGLKNEDINMFSLLNLFHDDHFPFIHEFHDRLLLYVYNSNQHLDVFSSTLLGKVKVFNEPIIYSLKVLNTDENGNLTSIIGRVKKLKKSKTSKVVTYSVKGILEDNFYQKINFDLDYDWCISEINIELLELLEKEKSISEISKTFSISKEEVTQRIHKLFARFEVNSYSELIEFAKKNSVLPNVFKINKV